MACSCRIFLARGLKPEEAQARSMMLYAYVFGVSLMHCGGFTADLATLKAWIAERASPPNLKKSALIELLRSKAVAQSTRSSPLRMAGRRRED